MKKPWKRFVEEIEKDSAGSFAGSSENRSSGAGVAGKNDSSRKCGARRVRGIDVKERHIRGAERLENKPFVDLALIGTTTRAARKTLAGNLSTGHFDRGLSRPFRCRGSSAPFRCQKPEG